MTLKEGTRLALVTGDIGAGKTTADGREIGRAHD